MSDNKPWVKDSGHATESELAARVQKYPIDGCWAAFYTDRFAAGRTADGVPLSTPENLLELRVFGEAGELWLCRSRVGQPFRWRLAVDAGDYLTETQLLDIAEQDGDSMMSTSGGPKRYFCPFCCCFPEFGSNSTTTMIPTRQAIPIIIYIIIS